MTARRAIELAGVGHGQQPFPLACRIGPFIATSGIHGVDPRTGAVVEGGAEAQVRQAFANLRRVLEAAGAGPDDVAQVLVTLTNRDDRRFVNQAWLDLFPEEPRPARNTAERDLPGGSLCQVIAYAWQM